MDTLISDWSKLGAAVRDARTARKWSQHELASRAGVSRSWLARVETGHRSAELEQILRVLDALGMSMHFRDPSRHGPAGSPAARPQPDADLAGPAMTRRELRRESWASARLQAADAGTEDPSPGENPR